MRDASSPVECARKSLRHTLAAVLLLCLLLPTTSLAAAHVKLKVAFDPNRRGARTTILFGLHISGPNGGIPPPVTSLDLRIPGDMGIVTSTLGQANCEPNLLIEHGLGGCSINARIGFGEAIGTVPLVSHPINERTSISVLMGPPTFGHLEFLFYAEGISPVFAAFVFPGTVTSDTSPFGDRINITVPLIHSWGGGPNVSLTSFSATIGPLHLTYFEQVGGSVFAYQPSGITAPKHCPQGGYPFGAELTFEGGSRATAITHVPCPRR